METNNESARVALFLDVENLVIEAQKAALAFRLEIVLDFAREAGILSFARGYANWNSATISPLLQQFQSNAVQMEHLSTSRGKNTADLQLSLDALEMVLLPRAPDIVIVAGGDRDFVPLVQKLRRYGIRVVGIGVEGTSSRCLAQVCDEFVYYDSLVRAEAEDGEAETAQTGSLAAVDPAFNLLIRSVDAQQRTGHAARGSSTRSLMQRLDPTLDLGRLGYSSFKAFVMAAVDAGYVTVAEPQGSDMEISTKISPLHIPQNPVMPTVRDSFQYQSDSAALDSYCRILRDTIKVPLIPWVEREDLVRYLVDQLASAPEGLTRRQVNDLLQHRAEEKGFSQPVRALEKLTQTLGIAECFRKNGKSGHELGNNPVRLHMAVDADAALELMHTTYLAGILGVDPDARLLPVAVAKLIFGSGEPTHVKLCKRLITEARKKATEKRDQRTVQ